MADDVEELEKPESLILDSGLYCLEQIIDELMQDDSSRLYCHKCHNAITVMKAKTEINGQFLHECINPQGFQFQIGCFQQSLGCDISGKASLEFTWFDGFSWQICSCNQCHEHLGWYFSRCDEHFYALIMKRLVQRGPG